MRLLKHDDITNVVNAFHHVPHLRQQPVLLVPQVNGQFRDIARQGFSAAVVHKKLRIVWNVLLQQGRGVTQLFQT